MEDGSAGGQERDGGGKPRRKNGQPAHTREVKLDVLFTQTTWDQEGYLHRESGFHHLHRPIETADSLGNASTWKLEARLEAAHKRESSWAMGEWIWNLPRNIFRARCRSSILYHARQHLWTCTQATSQTTVTQTALDEGPPKALARQGKIENCMPLRSILSTNAEVLEQIRSERLL